MTLLEALVLGVVQGVFMFVPVSSTSHLALTQHWMGSLGSSIPEPDSAEMILFDIVVHVGTLVSIVVVMRAGLARLLSGMVADVRQLLASRGGQPSGSRVPAAGRGPVGDDPVAVDDPVATGVVAQPRVEYLYLKLAVLGVVTTGVTGVLGLLVREVGTAVFATPVLIAVALIITGVILWWTDTAGPQWRGARQLTVWVAIGIGVAQAAALLPGLSRSGLTIAMALLLGLHRPIAAQYSFFVAIPTILSALVLQTTDVLGEGTAQLQIGFGAYTVAFVAAAVVGAVALALVLRLLYRAKFRYFSLYVWLLAIVILLVQPPHLA